MKFDAPTFARAWLSVAQASATKDDFVGLSKTVAIEEFTHGVRLVATDRFILLTAWVPELRVAGSSDPHYAEPALDEAPDRTVIAADIDGRGKSLLGYCLSLASRKDPYVEGEIPIGLMFDVRIKPGESEPETFEGMEPSYAVLSVPDVERVYLQVVETDYPSWRNLTVTFHAEEAKGIALNPEFVTRVCNVRRWCFGPLVWTFGGSDRVAAVDYPESDPHVTGFVMPSRWILPGEAPADEEDEDLSPGADLDADLDAARESDASEPKPRAFSDALHENAHLLPEGVSVVTSDGRESKGGKRHLSSVPADSPRGEAHTRDGMLRDAAALLAETQLGSENMVQKRLKVGYARAKRIMSQLEEVGIVGPATNGRPREVLVATVEDAEEMLNR